MEKWRPEGWQNPYLGVDPDGFDKQYNPGFIAYEAGADAMLEALKKRGKHFDGAMTLSGFYEGSGYTLSNKGNTGTYVFIPDDEVKNG